MSRQTELGAAPAVIHVVAGILLDDQGQVLIADRAQAKSMRDYWEFPGGKVDASESAERALQRELAEELGIEIFDPRHFRSIRHAYPDLAVSINFYLVRNWTGTPRGAEGQSIRWVAKDALVKHRLLPADLPVIEALAKLPRGDSADT